jgi:hypothetical protein
LLLSAFPRHDADELASLAFIFKLNNSGNLGKQSIVSTATHVQSWFNPSASLPHQNGATVDELATESLYA